MEQDLEDGLSTQDRVLFINGKLEGTFAQAFGDYNPVNFRNCLILLKKIIMCSVADHLHI